MQEIDHGMIHGIDPWNNTAPLEGTQKEWDAEWWGKWPAEQVKDEFLVAVEKFGVGHRVNVIKAKSEDAVKKFPSSSVDYVMIDGNQHRVVGVSVS